MKGFMTNFMTKDEVKDYAQTAWIFYQEFVDAGFGHENAMELVKHLMNVEISGGSIND